jgi:DNA gyrase subunit B
MRKLLAWQVDDVQVEVALQWCSDAFSDTIVGFVNSIKTIDGGTHMDGAVAAFYLPLPTLRLHSQRSDTLPTAVAREISGGALEL